MVPRHHFQLHEESLSSMTPAMLIFDLYETFSGTSQGYLGYPDIISSSIKNIPALQDFS